MAVAVGAANGLMQGCRGRSPRRNKLIVSPFPTGEGGWGDRGHKSKLKAGLAGGKGGKPPFRHHSGRDSRRPPPLRPPPGTTAAGRANAAGGKPPRRVPAWKRL